MTDEQAQQRIHEAERISRNPSRYSRAARSITHWAGSGWMAGGVVALFSAWIVVGVVSGYQRWWEVTVTVGFPFITLALLIVIQYTQNHDNQALLLKLDEIISAHGDASDAMLRVEDSSEDDLRRLQDHYGDSVSPAGQPQP